MQNRLVHHLVSRVRHPSRRIHTLLSKKTYFTNFYHKFVKHLKILNQVQKESLKTIKKTAGKIDELYKATLCTTEVYIGTELHCEP